jgi:Kef-type K+ transport system membrane component KefB
MVDETTDGVLDRLLAFRDLVGEHPLFAVGALLIVGYLLGRLAGKIGLPEITGFILAGIVMGEAVLGLVSTHMAEELTLVTEIALGLIALTIGGEFYWTKLRRLGVGIAVVTLVQLLASFAIVALALWVVRMPLPFALLMGAIAAATAPAATVAIVQSLRAQGTFIDYLYGVVALDDAGSVILFGLIFAFVANTISGGGEGADLAVLFRAVGEVGLSLLAGAISAVLIHIAARGRTNTNEVIITTLGLLFIATSAAVIFHLSPLLTNMTAGAVLINLAPQNHRIFRSLEPLTPPIYALFFVIAGTELRPSIIFEGDVLLFGLVYIIARMIGKYGGVYFGGLMSGISSRIRNYLGLCMFPQAGVAIGLVLLVQTSPMLSGLGPEQANIIDTMVNVVLFSVFVNELAGPPISRYAIIRGNEMEA